VEDLQEEGAWLGCERREQAVRVHERCDAPVEYRVAKQWFVRVLDFRQPLRQAGEQLTWHPPQMKNQYLQWLENLSWDWCISRQRPFGVPFPAWHCQACGEVRLAAQEALPVEPEKQGPETPCACGQNAWHPDCDVMDTWATSALTMQIAAGWGEDEALYAKVFPMSVRPLAHEIIRTWAFYSLVKAHHHWGCLPWKTLAVSGWGLAPMGGGKISKSRGGGPLSPQQLLERYPADALRYWAASTALGKDALISEEKIQAGEKLVAKLWNMARFAEPFLRGYRPPEAIPSLSPGDAWILARLQSLVEEATACLAAYDYATAKSLTEVFFWRDLADNYLEMVKKRLYAEEDQGRAGALFAVHLVVKTVTKLLAPFLPYAADAVYRALFGEGAVHASAWPQVDARLVSPEAVQRGEKLVAIATAVRRYKSAAKLSLGCELARLQVVAEDAEKLRGAEEDIASLTRAQCVEFCAIPKPGLEIVESEGNMRLTIVPKSPDR
jgi:valyl-tRNA synthetase